MVTSFYPFLLLTACMLLLLPAPLLAAHRMQAAVTTLALLMAALFLRAVIFENTATVPLFLLPCMAVLVAAPLMERARFYGLLAAALVAAAMIQYAVPEWLAPNLPARPDLALLPLSLIAALLVGMIGGARLPLHPQRHRADGQAVWHEAPQGRMLAGWLCLLAAFVLLCGPETLTRAHLAGSLVGGFVALMHAQAGHGRDAMQKAGEGLMAGFLLVLLAPVAPLAASLLGLFAGFFVARSEAIALALRLEDPHHFIGALLMPSMLGLLLPGLTDLSLLAGQIQWLGGTILLAAAISLILWPLTMLLLGVALPPRLVREGLATR